MAEGSGGPDPRPDAAARLAGTASAVAAERVEQVHVEQVQAPEPVPGAGAAFFDVDNTVVRGASLFHFAQGLYRRRFFTWRDLSRFAWKQARFRALGENIDHVHQAVEQGLAFVAGHSVAEMTAIGEDVYDEVIAAKVWPGTHALAQAHLDAGERVWLVTATPVEVAQVIARRLGLTGALGTVAESVDGVYTGRLVGQALHGAAKAEAVRALAAAEALELSRCSAYSDSVNDLPLLSLVGRPCAVNPDRALRTHARARGWDVRDYRRGRRAAMVGLPAATGVGAAAGGAMAVAALRRRWH
jgi:HAD superfamily hydrolase (TIGR01490 family)